jgi:hypothetical protein
MLPVGHGVYCSAVTRDGWRWTVDAHRRDGPRYIVQSDELLNAFPGIESDAAAVNAMLLNEFVKAHRKLEQQQTTIEQQQKQMRR